MKNFFFFSIAYAALAVLLAFLVRDNIGTLLDTELTKLTSRILSVTYLAPYIVLITAVAYYFLRRKKFANRMTQTLYAFVGCLVFASAFSIMKTTIPYLVPFYADEMLASLDAFLAFGVDPWKVTHQISGLVTPGVVEIVYFSLWIPPALLFPVILSATDTDKERCQRYLVLYCTCWILLGNVLALFFSSVGPVYYDKLLGGERFASLNVALASAGITEGWVGQAQAFLWQDYTERGQALGSGISAFPSVHVGMATIFAFYMAERSRYLALPGFAFLAAVLFCSIYIGWHYAIDGYVSILMMTAVWAVMYRRAPSANALAVA